MNYTSASALVTGGASGLGEATARLLSRRGVHVVVVDRDEDRGPKVAAEMGGEFARTDVTDPDQVVAAIEVAETLGPLAPVPTPRSSKPTWPRTWSFRSGSAIPTSTPGWRGSSSRTRT